MSNLVTLAETKTYISNKFDTTNWDALTDAKMQKAINEAENSILSIPFINIYRFESGVITQAVKNAVFEEAYAFVNSQVYVNHINNQNHGIKSESIDGYSISYDTATKKQLNSDIALKLLQPYIQRTAYIA